MDCCSASMLPGGRISTAALTTSNTSGGGVTSGSAGPAAAAVTSAARRRAARGLSPRCQRWGPVTAPLGGSPAPPATRAGPSTTGARRAHPFIPFSSRRGPPSPGGAVAWAANSEHLRVHVVADSNALSWTDRGPGVPKVATASPRSSRPSSWPWLRRSIGALEDECV